MEALLQYLQSREIYQIAPKSAEPWIANVYVVCESPERLYFITSHDNRFAKLIKEAGTVAFATASCDPNDHTDRKGIQGVGTCTYLREPEEMQKVAALHNRRFPEFADDITLENLERNYSDTAAWVIVPQHIKFWNDELYGDEGYKEFTF